LIQNATREFAIGTEQYTVRNGGEIVNSKLEVVGAYENGEIKLDGMDKTYKFDDKNILDITEQNKPIIELGTKQSEFELGGQTFKVEDGSSGVTTQTISNDDGKIVAQIERGIDGGITKVSDANGNTIDNITIGQNQYQISTDDKTLNITPIAVVDGASAQSWTADVYDPAGNKLGSSGVDSLSDVYINSIRAQSGLDPIRNESQIKSDLLERYNNQQEQYKNLVQDPKIQTELNKATDFLLGIINPEYTNPKTQVPLAPDYSKPDIDEVLSQPTPKIDGDLVSGWDPTKPSEQQINDAKASLALKEMAKYAQTGLENTSTMAQKSDEYFYAEKFGNSETQKYSQAERDSINEQNKICSDLSQKYNEIYNELLN